MGDWLQDDKHDAVLTRRSGWRLAVQRPRLFWAHWRLMKFRVRSINAAFRLAMV